MKYLHKPTMIAAAVAACLINFCIGACRADNWPMTNADRNNSAFVRILGVDYKDVWTAPSSSVGVIMAVAGDTLFRIDGGSLTANELKTGRVRWSRELYADRPGQYGGTHATGLAFHDGQLFVTTASIQNGDLQSFNAKDGKLNWSLSKIDGSTDPVLSGPAIFGDRAITRIGSTVRCVQVGDGRTLWKSAISSLNVPFVMLSAQPAIDEKRVYFNSDNGVAFALDVDTGKIAWTFRTDDYDSINSGAMTKTNVHVTYCAPLLCSTTLLSADDRNIYCLSKASGDLLWKCELGHTFQFASAGNRIFAATSKGFFELEPASGKVIHAREIRGGIWTCAVSAARAILTHNPVNMGGWEILDLKSWGPVFTDSKFSPDPVLATSGNMLVLVGVTGLGTDPHAIRKYRILCSKAQ